MELWFYWNDDYGCFARSITASNCYFIGCDVTLRYNDYYQAIRLSRGYTVMISIASVVHSLSSYSRILKRNVSFFVISSHRPELHEDAESKEPREHGINFKSRKQERTATDAGKVVEACKRCFKPVILGGEVLTNGITLCLLVIRGILQGFFCLRLSFPRSPVSFYLTSGSG